MTAALKNPQNDRLNCRQEERRCSETSALHAIRVQPVPDGTSRYVKTGLIFVEPGVKVNGAYTTVTFFCCNIMLPDIRHIASEFFIFQQDSAPAHRAREMMLLMILNARLQLSFCWICSRWTAQTSIRLTTKFEAWCSNESRPTTAKRGRFETASDWRVEWNGTRRYWRRHWRMAQMSTCMCSGQRRTLWIFSDLLISLICSVKICR